MTDAPSSSFLGQLAARRQQIEAEQVLDLPVPRWTDPEIHVRYRPLTADEVGRFYKRIAKSDDDTGVILDENAALLVKACLGIYALLDGKEYSLRPDEPEGELTRFDKDLATNLGIDDDRAISVCKELFITDLDLMGHTRQIAAFSGETAEKVEEAFEGE